MSAKRVRYTLYVLLITAAFLMVTEALVRVIGQTTKAGYTTLKVADPPFKSWPELLSNPAILEKLGTQFDYIPFTVNREENTLGRSDGALPMRPFMVPLVKAAGELRVLFLGGSSVYGFGEEAEAIFPSVVESFLAGKLGQKKVSVINAGVLSGNSFLMLDNFSALLPHWQPDIVVVYSGHNEYYPLMIDTMPDMTKSVFGHRGKWLYEHSDLVRALAWFYRGDNKEGQWVARFEKRYSIPGSQRWQEWLDVKDLIARQYKTNLVSLVRLAHERGVKVLLIPATSNLLAGPNVKIHGPLFRERDLKSFNEKYEKVMNKIYQNNFSTDLTGECDQLIEMDRFYSSSYYECGLAELKQDRKDAAIKYLRQARDTCVVKWGCTRALSDIAQITSQVALQESAEFLDVEEGLIKNERYWDLKEDNPFFNDCLHFSAEGHRVMAELINGKLEELSWTSAQ